MERGGGTIVPGKENVVIPAFTDTELTVQGDADLIASNIKQGANIFGVAGNVVPKTQTITVNSGTANNADIGSSISVEHGLGKIPTYYGAKEATLKIGGKRFYCEADSTRLHFRAAGDIYDQSRLYSVEWFAVLIE